MKTIRCRVISATGLPSADTNGLSDPYAELFLGGFKVKTRVVKRSLSPQWHQDFTLNVANTNDVLVIRVKDKDKFSRDDLLGEAQLPLNSLPRGKEKNVWLPLRGKFGKPAGQINLGVTPNGFGKNPGPKMHAGGYPGHAGHGGYGAPPQHGGGYPGAPGYGAPMHGAPPAHYPSHAAPQVHVHHQQVTHQAYPPTGAYPPQPYPPQPMHAPSYGAPAPGYPGQAPNLAGMAPGGYPPQQHGGYPPQPYPPQGAPGYPGQAPGYPGY